MSSTYNYVLYDCMNVDDSLSDDDDPSTDSLDVDDTICNRKTVEQTCSDHESDILSTWDPYQSVYMSISDDASEEKLDATCLQTDWQPYQDDDDDYDLFSTDNLIAKEINKEKTFRRSETADGDDLESDSEAEDLDDVITETRNAKKFIITNFERMRKMQAENVLRDLSRQEMDQKKWKKFLKNALATCSTSIVSLSQVLEALQTSSNQSGIIKSSVKHLKNSHQLECVKDLLLQMKKLVTKLNEYEPPSLEEKRRVRVAINKDESHTSQHEEEKSQVNTCEPLAVTRTQLNDNLSGKTFPQTSGIDIVKTSSQTLAAGNINGIEWIETENCTHDKLHILNTTMSSSGITDSSNIEYHRDIDRIQSSTDAKPALTSMQPYSDANNSLTPIQSHSYVKPSLTTIQSHSDGKQSFPPTKFDDKRIQTEIIQSDGHRMFLLFFNIMLVLLFLFLLILFGIVISRISHVSFIITPLLSYVRGPPPT